MQYFYREDGSGSKTGITAEYSINKLHCLKLKEKCVLLFLSKVIWKDAANHDERE